MMNHQQAPNRAKELFDNSRFAGEGLKNRAVGGAFINLAAKVVQIVISIVNIAVLSRLLAPDDFGLLGMTSFLVVTLTVLSNAGLATATVQRSEISHQQVSTLFWINISISAFLGIGIALLAPLVAYFFGRDELTGITVVLGLSLAFGGLQLQHRALLERNMRFATLSAIELISQLTKTTVAIALALKGFGYWSLVLNQVADIPIRILATWWATGWIPGLPRRGTGALSMLRFGSYLTLSNLFSTTFRKADDIIIGKVAGSIPLGYYTKAYQLLLFPMAAIHGPLNSVAISFLSKLQHDQERFKRAWKQAITLLYIFSVGIVGLFLATSENLITLAIGEKWLPCVDAYRSLAGLAFISALNGRGWITIVRGETHKIAVTGLCGALLGVPAMLIGVRYGIEGVGLGVSITSVITCIGSTFYFYHGTDIKPSDFLECCWRQLFSAILSALLTIWISNHYLQGDSHSRVIALLYQTLIYSSSYATLFACLPGGRAHLADLFRFGKNLIGQIIAKAYPSST